MKIANICMYEILSDFILSKPNNGRKVLL